MRVDVLQELRAHREDAPERADSRPESGLRRSEIPSGKTVRRVFNSSAHILRVPASAPHTHACTHIHAHTHTLVDPLSYFSLQPVLHDWCNQRPWYVLSRLWDDAYKRTLAANRKE